MSQVGFCNLRRARETYWWPQIVSSNCAFFYDEEMPVNSSRSIDPLDRSIDRHVRVLLTWTRATWPSQGSKIVMKGVGVGFPPHIENGTNYFDDELQFAGKARDLVLVFREGPFKVISSPRKHNLGPLIILTSFKPGVWVIDVNWGIR